MGQEDIDRFPRNKLAIDNHICFWNGNSRFFNWCIVASDNIWNLLPYITMIKVDAEAQNSKNVTISVGHRNAYIATAISLSACISQMLEKDLFSQKRVFLMGHFFKFR